MASRYLRYKLELSKLRKPRGASASWVQAGVVGVFRDQASVPFCTLHPWSPERAAGHLT